MYVVPHLVIAPGKCLPLTPSPRFRSEAFVEPARERER